MTETQSPPTQPPDAGMAATIQALSQQAANAGAQATQGMLNIILDNIRTSAYQLGHQAGVNSCSPEIQSMTRQLDELREKFDGATADIAAMKREGEATEDLAVKRQAAIEAFCSVLAEDKQSSYDAIRFACVRAIGAIISVDMLPADIPEEVGLADLLGEVALISGGSGTGLSGRLAVNATMRTGADAMSANDDQAEAEHEESESDDG